jgi:serine/threonine-protein phosphatase 2A regulatory subunit B
VRIYAKSDVSHVPEAATKTTPGSVMRSALWGRGAATAAGKDGGAAGKGGIEYRPWHEFQSHEAEFDYLKSLEIEEKINCLRWCKPINSAFMVLTTNDKTIKLWRIQDRKRPVAVIDGYKNSNGNNATLKVPQFRKESAIGSSSRRVFANGHAYHINSISLNR